MLTLRSRRHAWTLKTQRVGVFRVLIDNSQATYSSCERESGTLPVRCFALICPLCGADTNFFLSSGASGARKKLVTSKGPPLQVSQLVVVVGGGAGGRTAQVDSKKPEVCVRACVRVCVCACVLWVGGGGW